MKAAEFDDWNAALAQLEERERATWLFEHQRVIELLQRLQRTEEAALQKMGCPIEPLALYDMLDKRTPWPTGVTPRQQQRAKQLMYSLLALQKIEQYLGPLHENARRAAETALIAGIHIGARGRAALTATIGALAKAQKARDTSEANRWQEEVETRRAGQSKADVMRRIEQREGLKPGTVKKALTRRHTRATKK